MSERLLFLLPALLALQAGLVNWIGSAERPPAAPELSRLPDRLGGWNKIQENPIAEDIASILHADRLLDRTYVEPSQRWTADLFVAWFQSQKGGESQPHSPQVCLPASGWTPRITGPVALATPEGTFSIERYVIANGGSRAVVLYWYQTPRRVVANEWMAKFWIVADALRDHRTDTSLVRVVIYTGNRSMEETSSAALSFARDVYPALRENFPPLADRLSKRGDGSRVFALAQ
jgi:EpsI family protein